MEIPTFYTSTNNNTDGLMFWLTRYLWSTGKTVIMDIGFFVLKGLVEMRKRGFYGSTLIKIYAIDLGGFMDM